MDAGPKFTWLNASFAMMRQAVRLRPGPQAVNERSEFTAVYAE